SLYLISFAEGKEVDTQASFNDYTWNDILDSDIIAGTASKLMSGMTKEYLANATTVPTMSDIRLFHIYVEDPDAEKADMMQTALELALAILPEYVDGMENISAIERGKAELVIPVTTITRWAVAGAVIGVLAALLLTAYVYIMDDTVRIAEDIKSSGARCLGVMFRNAESKAEEDRLKAALNEVFKDVKEIRMTDPAGTAVSSAEADKIKSMLPEDIKYNTGNREAADLFCVAAGSIGISELKRFIEGKEANVVLCGADHKLHRVYYFYSNKKEAVPSEEK
ncbi:MAG: hypothetical protein J6X66_11800, partial [Lachnospiraceae bacterium]|nr:hypothetical protein [Lachnospiraceae bacterium]